MLPEHQASRLHAGKNVAEMTHFVSSGTSNLNSVNQLEALKTQTTSSRNYCLRLAINVSFACHLHFLSRFDYVRVVDHSLNLHCAIGLCAVAQYLSVCLSVRYTPVSIKTAAIFPTLKLSQSVEISTLGLVNFATCYLNHT